MLLWILGFMTFGYATREFEVTSERLGCYRPEEHIDNPKGVLHFPRYRVPLSHPLGSID